MIAIGIDIGLTGAVAAIDHNGRAAVHDLPVVLDGELRTRRSNDKRRAAQRLRLDGRGLLHLLRELVPAGEAGVVVIEDVRARPAGNGGAHGNTMHSQGSLMRSRGIVEGVLDVLGAAQVQVVQPQTWKRHFGLLRKKGQEDAGKDRSRDKARALYPGACPLLARVKDHNRAEALLLAHYGLHTLGLARENGAVAPSQAQQATQATEVTA